jgi:hypothetical protein
MFKGMLPDSVTPKLENQSIVIRITAEEFREMALKGVQSPIKDNIHIAIEAGAIVISIKVM